MIPVNDRRFREEMRDIQVELGELNDVLDWYLHCAREDTEDEMTAEEFKEFHRRVEGLSGRSWRVYLGYQGE